MEEDYVEVTPQNVRKIREELKRPNGRLLISEPGYQSFKPSYIIDAHIGLWDSPVFDSETSFHVQRGSMKRNGEDWQTNWEKDRDYSLRPHPESTGDKVWDSCRELFDKLVLGFYEFKIGFQDTVGRGIFADNGITLYIPRNASLGPAFRKGLSHMVRQINQTIEQKKLPQKPFTEEDVERIAQYIIKDYINRQVFEHNIRAGLEADAVLF